MVVSGMGFGFRMSLYPYISNWGALATHFYSACAPTLQSRQGLTMFPVWSINGPCANVRSSPELLELL